MYDAETLFLPATGPLALSAKEKGPLVFASGLLLVGDAARVIDPITGGGIANGTLQGKIAGEVLRECTEARDFSETALLKYERQWRDEMENKLWRNWMAKEKLITLDDKTLDSVVQTLSECELPSMSVYALLAALKQKLPELVKEFEELI